MKSSLYGLMVFDEVAFSRATPTRDIRGKCRQMCEGVLKTDSSLRRRDRSEDRDACF